MKIGFDQIGARIPRLDGVQKVTGRMPFAADFERPGTLVAKLVASTVAHARIASIDTSEAESLPGVVAVLTGRDLPRKRYGQLVKDQMFLPTDRIRHFGEPLAAIAAIDERTAEEAAQLVRVEYERLPVLGTALEAMAAGAPLVHEDAATYEAVPMTMESPLPFGTPQHGTNLLFDLTLRDGDPEHGFGAAARIFEETYTVPMVAHAAMEPHACAAEIDGEGRLTVWTPTQTVSRVQAWVADYFEIPSTRVRVVGMKPGGGFGAKIGVVLEPYVVALAIRTGRPIRLVLTRIETFQMVGGWLPGSFRFRTGVSADGTLVARAVDAIWSAGAYSNTSPVASANAALVALGPYRSPHTLLSSQLVYTNLPGARPYRGLAATQATWAAERHIDSVAAAIGRDPLEFRLQNCLRPGDRTAWGEVITDNRLRECLAAAAAEIGWGEQPATGAGKGIASMWKMTLPGFVAECRVELQENGEADVFSGTIDIGTGSEVVLGQVAAEVLGLPMESVRVHMGDTDYGLEDSGAAASRTAVYAGSATLRAANRVKDQVLTLAARELGVGLADLELAAGRVRVRARPEAGLALSTLLQGGGTISAQGEFTGEVHTEVAPGHGIGWRFADWKFGACAAEVKVDRETGTVAVERVVAAHDIGRVLNRLNVETQAHGCVVMGVGAALYEEQVFEAGQPVNPNFMEYLLPTALEAPGEVVPIFIESGQGHGPFGSRGFGELPIIAVGAALGNAVAAAIGIQLRDLPMTPERILLALDSSV